MKLITDKKWLKLGAATFLSVGLLAACADGEDDTDVDVNNPPADVEDGVDDGTDTNVDLDVDDDTDTGTDTDTDDSSQ